MWATDTIIMQILFPHNICIFKVSHEYTFDALPVHLGSSLHVYYEKGIIMSDIRSHL